MGPNELRRHLEDQQNQFRQLVQLVERQTKIIENLQTQTRTLAAQVVDLATALNLFSEFSVNASPELKQLVAEATTQILEKREFAENPFLRELLSNLKLVATTPTRLTPEGRRQHIKPVSLDDDTDKDT